MPKYYVSSGDLKKIVNSSGPLEAARKALLMASGEVIGKFFCVDERGFRDGDSDTVTTDEVPEFLFSHDKVFKTIGDE